MKDPVYENKHTIDLPAGLGIIGVPGGPPPPGGPWN